MFEMRRELSAKRAALSAALNGLGYMFADTKRTLRSVERSGATAESNSSDIVAPSAAPIQQRRVRMEKCSTPPPPPPISPTSPHTPPSEPNTTMTPPLTTTTTFRPGPRRRQLVWWLAPGVRPVVAGGGPRRCGTQWPDGFSTGHALAHRGVPLGYPPAAELPGPGGLCPLPS